MQTDKPMTWIVFTALVIVSSIVSYVLREQRHRRRWQLVDLPTVNAGVGAYREGMVPQGVMAEAPGALRALAFSCIVYGRAFTFALLATALTLAGASLDTLANPTLHAMLGYFVAGLGVGAIGVMILSAFLASRYAARQAFALNASLAFEQTYGPIDGDSASLAELCAILSSISGIPICQNWAVTGSIDQAGHVQAIGAVNEKIEGFYDICAARGLDGRQGVLIPATNVRHLMLRDDVVGAVRDGRFAVHAVSSVDEAMALLTGRDDVDAVVRARLAELGKLRQKILAPAQRNRQARS